MKYSASTLSMLAGGILQLKNLDPAIGVEIFYEWASRETWNHALAEAMPGRKGGFSIHSPYIYADVCKSDEEDLFRQWQEPFDLYHKYNAEFYVIHSHGNERIPDGEEERAVLRKKVTDRIIRFAKICKENGVHMVVENLFDGPKGPLFRQAEFIQLFREVPEIDCLIDTGHAVLGGYDIYEVQKALGSRIVGYHMHDNDGIHDSHFRVGDARGVIDWKRFFEGFCAYTPDAVMVMEYVQAEICDYTEDMAKMNEWIQRG